jgi:hypothetical protein
LDSYGHPKVAGMTNTLTQLRIDVAETLSDNGLTAYAFIPDRATPPLVGVTPDSPYITDGPTFNVSTINLTIRCINRPGTPDKEDEQMEDTISAVIAALKPFGFNMTVNKPGYLTIGNADYPTCDINVSTEIEIEGGA